MDQKLETLPGEEGFEGSQAGKEKPAYRRIVFDIDDSHRWSPVAIDQVVGKAVFVYWPPEEWDLLGGGEPEFSPP